MSIENQDRIQQISDLIVKLDNQRTAGGISLQTIEEIGYKIKKLEDERGVLEKTQAEEEKAEREQKIEEKAAEVITFNVPGVDMKNLPPEVIQLADILIRYERKQIYSEEMEKADKVEAIHKEELRAAAEREINLKFQNDEMQKIIETGTAANQILIRENGELRDHSYTLNAEKSDFETRLRNAAAQIEEQQTEIERLNNKVFEYQEAKVNGVKEKNIIDVPAESVTEVQGLVDAIAKKYIASNPIGGNWHEIVADDGSKEVVHEKDLPSIAQQESPHTETAEIDAGSNQVLAAESTVEAPTFQTIAAPALGSIQISGQPVDGGVPEKAAEEYITRGEFNERLAELEARITREKAA